MDTRLKSLGKKNLVIENHILKTKITRDMPGKDDH